jgi:hypothetical protein
LNQRWRYALGLVAIVLIALVYYLSRSDAPSEVKPPIAQVIVTPTPQALPVQPQGERPPRATRPLPDEATITSLRAKAKLNLSMLYTGQASFFADYNRYSTDLVFIGWSPSQEQMDFKLGFLSEYRPTKLAVVNGTEEDPSRLDSDEFLGGDDRYQYTTAAEPIKLFDYEKFCRSGCTATKTSYEILVVLPLGDSGKVDVWSINQDKKLRQLWDGVTGQAVPSL